MSAWASAQRALVRRWSSLQARERTGLQWAGAVLAAYLVWTVALAPPLRLLRHAPAQQQQLDAQLERMHAWRNQAEAVKNTPASNTPWREELNRSVQALGQAELQWTGTGATLRLTDCPPQALGRWLADISQWRVRVSAASLQQDERGLWQGQLNVDAP